MKHGSSSINVKLSILFVLIMSLFGTFCMPVRAADGPGTVTGNYQVTSDADWEKPLSVTGNGRVLIKGVQLIIKGAVTSNTVSGSDGLSAFRIENKGKLIFDGVTITQGSQNASRIIVGDNGSSLEMNGTVIDLSSAGKGAPYIWMQPGASGDLTNVTIKGKGKTDDLNVFIRVGGIINSPDQTSDTKPGGTITFFGANNRIENVKGKIRNYGTITIANGAVLTISNSDIDLSNTSATTFTVAAGGKLVIENSVIHNYNGNNSVIVSDGGTVEISGSTFNNNTAANKNGGVIFSNNSDITITGSTFKNNSALKGGAVCIEGGQMKIDGGTTFENNISKYINDATYRFGGGAIYALNSTVEILDVTFKNNSAYYNGGAICQDGGTLTLGNEKKQTIFENNSVLGYKNNAGKFVGPKWVRGGAVAVDNDCLIDLNQPNKCNINTSKDMTLNIKNASFLGNEALHEGGALSAGYGTKGDRYSTYADVYNNPKLVNIHVNIEKAEFIGNKVTENQGNQNIAGGAIAIQTNAIVEMKDAAFVNNSTNNSGGAIASCMWGSNNISYFDGAAIFDNIAEGAPAAYQDIYVMNSKDPVHQSNIDESRMFNGGLVKWNIQEDESLIYQNYQGQRRGAVVADEDKVIDGSTGFKKYQVLFRDNSAVSVCANDALDCGNGGAIGNNGTLRIGSTPEQLRKIEIEKTWSGDENTNNRPEVKEFLEQWLQLLCNNKNYPIRIDRTSCDEVTKICTCDAVGTENQKNLMITVENYDSNTWNILIDGLDKTFINPLTNRIENYSWELKEKIGTFQNEFGMTVCKYQCSSEGLGKVTGNMDQGFSISNEYNLTDISGEKSWDYTHEGQTDPNPPAIIYVHLHQDGTPMSEYIEVTGEDGWKWEFKNLPKYKNDGSEHKYSVHEKLIPNYVFEPDGYNIRNTYRPGLRSISVLKFWDDDSNRDGLQRDLKITLYDGKGDSIGSKELKRGETEITFENLPIFDSTTGEVINYQIKEEGWPVDVPHGYDEPVIIPIEEPYETPTGTTTNVIVGFRIINKHDPIKVKLSLQKTWDDEDNKYETRPADAEQMLEFLNSCRIYAGEEMFRLSNLHPVSQEGSSYTYQEGDRDIYVIVNTDTWVIEVTGLPMNDIRTHQRIEWRIQEEEIGSYTPMDPQTKEPVTIIGGEFDENEMVWRYSILNSLDMMEITINKVWTNINDVTTPLAFMDGLRLYYQAEGQDKVFFSHGQFTQISESADKKTYEFGVEDHPSLKATLVKESETEWTITVDHMPKRDENGNELTWSVEETLSGYKAEINGLEITNTPVIDIEVNKIWLDDIEDVIVISENEEEDPVVAEGGHPEVTVTLNPGGQTMTLTALNGWRGVFSNLPKYDADGNEIEYTVTEADVEGYSTTQVGYTFINIKLIDIPFRKVWIDDPEGEHPAITVYLTIDGNDAEGVAPVTLSSETGWEGIFEALPMYNEDGTKPVYSVREDVPEGYQALTISDEDGVLVITNKKIQPTPPVWPPFIRIWEDELPKTGFSAVRPTVLSEKPQRVSYAPSGLTLQIPSLDVMTNIVTVPYTDGEYPVEWLGNQAGMLEGSAIPGEGYSVLTGHNHLNTMEAGPFALLNSLEEGDMIFVTNGANELRSFRVYANQKISADDGAALQNIAMKFDGSLTLLTCEDESPEGGYVSRRVVAAKPN